MEKGNARRTRRTQQQSLDDVPTELMHRIQSLLSEIKEAARTCVLSKSWLHAWSTIPNLRFPMPHHVTTNSDILIYNTIRRYHNHNLPIETVKVYIHVLNLRWHEFWIRCSETRSCLKELSLDICTSYSVTTDPSEYTFSDDILFAGDKLQTIKLRSTCFYCTISPGINPVIKCVSLRVLELAWVDISEEVFHNVWFTCSLLEKVILYFCRGLKRIKVKNLVCLYQLNISSFNGHLEIDNVPNLRFFYYNLCCIHEKNLLPFKTTDTTASSLGRSVTWLRLEGMIIDDTFCDMIKSKFPFLQILELQKGYLVSETLVITSLSLRRLTLWLMLGHRLTNLQVYAPNLFSFNYYCKTLPTLLFPIIAPQKIVIVRLNHENPLDTPFFLKLREVLNTSSKFEIYIDLSSSREWSPFPLIPDDVDNLRKGVMFPATNVQQLSLTIGLDDRFSTEVTQVFDSFFSICHPIHVKVKQLWNNNKSFHKLTIRGMMENSTTDLKDVLMKNPHDGIWEALTNLSETLPYIDNVEFKLKWFSHD